MTTETIDRQTSLPLAGAPAESALAIVEPEIQLAVDASDKTVTAAQVRVLKATICSKMTIEQLQLYLTICARKGVDPFTEAYGFPQKEGGLAFGLRIDGMRSLALRTGQLKSITTETIFDGEKKLAGARTTIERDGMTKPVIEEAWMGEYARSGMGWDQFPETMIRKVSAAKALRVAFADALSGVYEPAEMGNADAR